MQMQKVVVYLATRNYYEKVLYSLKSLYYHTEVDKVYLLIENDTFPYTLPSNVQCINVKNQNLYKEDGPNYNTRWSYITLLKPALSRILPPDIDVALCLDADTIILDDISGIWDLPISDYYFAASAEPNRTNKSYIYTNIGVCLFNLAKLRGAKTDELIQALNTKKYEVVDQDALVELCQGHILDMDGRYNVSNYTLSYGPPKIRHFAGEKFWFNDPLVKCYRDIFFDEILEMREKERKQLNNGTTDSDPAANADTGVDGGRL